MTQKQPVLSIYISSVTHNDSAPHMNSITSTGIKHCRNLFICLQFVLDLLRERPIYAADKITGKQHFVSPPELANRIMVARKALAGGMSKFDFPTYIQRTNTEVLRQHLESNSYTSGSYEKVERRRQRRI